MTKVVCVAAYAACVIAAGWYLDEQPVLSIVMICIGYAICRLGKEAT